MTSKLSHTISSASQTVSETVGQMSAKIGGKMYCSSSNEGPVVQLDATISALKDAFMEISLMKKLMILIWMIIAFPLYNLNLFIFSRIFNREKNKDFKKLDENIWVSSGSIFSMFKLYPSHMMIVKGKDGTLLVYNPIELQTSTLVQIQELGPVKAIFVSHHFHDLWIRQWKERFPHVSIYTVKSMRSQVERSIAVDNVIEEDPDMCDNFGIVQINDISGMMRRGIHDYFLSIESSTKRKVMVLPHVASTEMRSIKYWPGTLLGYFGAGFSMINSLVYVKDLSELKEYSAYTLEQKKPHILFSMHGKTLDTESEIKNYINLLKKK
jgi:hypothetical protein